MASSLRTVSAFQSLLKEDDYDLKEAGLKSLLSNVNLHWSDIANNIGDMYHSTYVVRASSVIQSSRISNWQPYFSPSSTSTSTTIRRHSTTHSKVEHTSTLMTTATSPRCLSTRVSNATLSMLRRACHWSLVSATRRSSMEWSKKV